MAGKEQPKRRRAFVVLLGAPGAGKGTQAQLLSQALGLAHISSGDLFREHLKNGTPLGKLAQQYMDRGELVPDDVTIGMVQERLQRPDCQGGAILDGFPRTIPQAEALEALLEGMGEKVCLVPYILVPPEVLLERLSGRWTCQGCGAVCHMLHDPPKRSGVCDVCGGELYQRQDDAPETQKRRIEVYLAQTSPLVEYYRGRGVLKEINGDRTIDAVQADLRAAVEELCVQPA